MLSILPAFCLSLLSASLLLPLRCGAEEWRPVKRRPTNEYAAPSMNRVHYWHRRPISSMELEQPPPMPLPNVASNYQPVPPFMLLPPSLKDASHLHLWSSRDQTTGDKSDGNPWKWKAKDANAVGAAESSPADSAGISLPTSTQPPRTAMASTYATTTVRPPTTEDPVINLVEPLQLVIEGHSKVRKYGVTYLPFELAHSPVFKKGRPSQSSDVA